MIGPLLCEPFTKERIASLQAQVDAFSGPMKGAFTGPFLQEIADLKEDLAAYSAEEIAAKERAGQLQSALKILGDTNVAPEISTASIDKALGRVNALATKMHSISKTSGAAPAAAA
ncbi:MAG: hypothetical protein CR958_00275, partial [Rhodobacterales bacterium]